MDSSDQALGLLRPALELALGVARRGMEATPAVVPPRSLRPVLRHAKLAPRALATVRDALEDDDGFRARVVAEARPDDLGRLPFGWLARQPGWEGELRQALEAGAAAAASAAEERSERQARRRLEAAEARRAEAEEEAARSRAAADEAQAQLTVARQQRRVAEDEGRELAASLQSMGGAVEQLEQALADAMLARRQLEALLDDAHGRIDALVAERDEARARARSGEAAARRSEEAIAARDREDGHLRSGLSRAVDDAAAAATALGSALGAAAALLDGRSPPEAAPEAPPLRAVAPPVVSLEAMGRVAAAAPTRRPVALPPAVWDDSAEAATFLVAVPGMVLAVDGYNVSLSGWPDDDLARQRRALLDRLAALGARTGVEVRVFFDGAEDHEMPPPRGRARDSVRVTFSAAGTDADEDIIAFVDDLDPTRSATVATSDRRVADEVRRRGANVVSSAQLLAVLGRVAGR